MSRKLGKRKLQERINDKIETLHVLGATPSHKALKLEARGNLKGALERLTFEAVIAAVRDDSFMSRFVDWEKA